MSYLLALDQGTSSTRSVVFNDSGQIVGLAQQEHQQFYPREGWVEHDPLEIWGTQLDTARQAIHKAHIKPQEIAAVGITNQRETTVLWNTETGEPLYPAIVWQDRRSESYCAKLREKNLEDTIIQRTGLRIDAYFSGTKLQWLFDNVPQARQLAQANRLAFGTIDSWLIWKLTKGEAHVTDVSNASRTLLFNIKENQWDKALLDAMDIPATILPTVLPSAGFFGTVHPEQFGHAIPISGVAGDQQSALFGQACFTAGMAKNTYGTGCFMLMNTGHNFQVSKHGLVTTSTAQITAQPEYALEGSVFIAGAVVQWLRDGLKAIKNSRDIEALAGSVPDSGGVHIVPAFTGLGAPWWKPNARGIITGITGGTHLGHIARAAIESIAFQSASVLQAMSQDARNWGGQALTELRVDGGASVNNALMQFQADLLGIPVVRPTNVETTALGAAWLAGLGCGMYQDTDVLQQAWQQERVFEPKTSRDEATERMATWEHAVRQACTD